MQRFWELEDVPQVSRRSPSHEECEAIFASSRRAADGRYIVRLPLKRGGLSFLGDSLPSALASLRSLRRRLQRDPEMAAAYKTFLKEYQDQGHMRPLTDAEVRSSRGPVHYIPHHGIWQGSDRGKKLRVVFNASRPTSTGYSLNDALHSRPKLQTPLPSVLVRWRWHRIAFCADIRMMFRQIWVDQRDIDLQRIVWSANEASAPIHFQLLTITYGQSCSPYLSLRTLVQLCKDEGDAWPEAVPIVTNDRYADDILAGADNVDAARTCCDQLIGLLEAGGFPLQKWVANAPELLADLPEDCRLRPTWRQLSTEGLVAELGIHWDPATDRFQLTPPPMQVQRTKRTILAALARLFDPCGWLAPVVLVAKLLMQDLWCARLDWDEVMPPSMAKRWETFLSQFQHVTGVSVPRWIGCHPTAKIQLHAFSDASRRAMAAVIYSRVSDPLGRTRTCLLLAKTKLVPIRSLKPASTPAARMTIPRLELRAAVLAAKLLRSTADELAVPVKSCHAWSDSHIVLSWIRSSEPTSNALVDDYVTHVQEPSHIWRYVPMDSNPADVTSRGTDLPSIGLQRSWWDGPARMSEECAAWPQEPADRPTSEPARDDQIVLACCTIQRRSTTVLHVFSTHGVLLRFLVRCRRWLRSRLGRSPAVPVQSPMSALELDDAFLACVRLSQRCHFPDELKYLRKVGRLPARHSLSSLCPFLHSDGVLRVGGRLHHSTLSFAERHPPIISSSKCPLTRLVIAWAHSRVLHGGARVTGAYAARRARIIGGRRQIKAQLRGCILCARLQARFSTQLMAPLPTARATPARAFSRTGVDYAGPFQVLSARGCGIRTSKGYVAVFVCLGTKALHLELVGDLSTASFLGALTRFCGRRGRPSEIWSDNATCFRRADLELQEAIRATKINWDLISGSLADQGIAWRFIPPGAPHFGGLWEAGVQSVKAHLRRVLGPRNLIYEEFATVLTSIEMVLNSRPLTPLTGDPNDLEVLTRSHFLVDGPLTSVVELGTTEATPDRLAHWELVRCLRDHFWARWSREYLNTLQQRPK